MRVKLSNKIIYNDLISIVLPVYNSEKIIKRAVKSIINQTYTHWELILIDDGSIDSTISIIKKINDHRIKKLFFKENKGLVEALNTGISLSQGSFIARMDADDISFPERLACQLKFLKENKSYDLVGSQQLIFDDNTKKILKIYPTKNFFYLAQLYYFSFLIPHPTWMARSKWFKKHLYQGDNMYSEDQELLIRGSTSSNYYLIDKPLLFYSNTNVSLSKKIKANKNILIKRFNNYRNNRYIYKNKIYAYIILDISFFIIKVLLYLSTYIFKNLFKSLFKSKSFISSSEIHKIFNDSQTP